MRSKLTGVRVVAAVLGVIDARPGAGLHEPGDERQPSAEVIARSSILPTSGADHLGHTVGGGVGVEQRKRPALKVRLPPARANPAGLDGPQQQGGTGLCESS